MPFPPRRVIGFFHIAKLGHWMHVVPDMVRRIKESGLWDATEQVNIGQVGEGPFVEDLVSDPKCRVVYSSPDVEENEAATLRCLSSFAKTNPDVLYWYVHTKGVSRHKERGYMGDATRNIMLDVVADQWTSCVEALGCVDVCGAMWRWSKIHKPRKLSGDRDRRSFGRGFFMGNFWWARGGYLAGLPILPYEDWKGFADRYQAEMWVGWNFPRVACLYRDNKGPSEIGVLQAEAMKSMGLG